MKHATSFELLLDNDPSARGKTLEKIRQEIGKTAHPVFDPAKDALKDVDPRYFELTMRLDAPDVWDVAREIARIDGVEDVDPIPGDVGAEQIAAMEAEGERETNMDAIPNPPADWFHEQPHFAQAIEYAQAAFEKQNGAFNGIDCSVKIGLLDTGYSNHPETINIRKDQGYSFVKPPWYNRIFNWNWENNPKDRLISFIPFKWGSHGTSSSSVIIGVDTPGAKFIDGHEDRTNGVFPQAQVIPYRISDSVISLHNNLARGAKKAIADGCKVLTASHANLIRTRMLTDVAEEAYEKGVLWFAAAGSHIAKLKKVWIYPARFRETIATAASTVDGEPWEKTHAGVLVDICAPGFKIYRPIARRKFRGWFGAVSYGYGWGEGSTFAAPITAAAAALWLTHHGEEKLNQHYPKGWQRVEAFRKVMKDSATPHTAPEHQKLYGAGLLNVEKMLETPLPDASQLQHVKMQKAAAQNQAIDQDRVTDRELTQLTGTAKILTNDEKNDELFDFVQAGASAIAKRKLENIVADNVNSGQDVTSREGNPRSKALKLHIKQCEQI